MSEDIIQHRKDAAWYLRIAEDLDPELPIDKFVRSDDDRHLNGSDHGIRAARMAVYTALVAAHDLRALAAAKQSAKGKTPDYFSGLAKACQRAIDAYQDIDAALSGYNVNTALELFTEAMREQLSPERAEKAAALFKTDLSGFRQMEGYFFAIGDWCTFATTAVRPAKGRAIGKAFFFVQSLAESWFKLTGQPPTRIFDPIKGAETGSFHSFCSASALTVKSIMPLISIDAAVRRVCENWSRPVRPRARPLLDDDDMDTMPRPLRRRAHRKGKV